MNLKIKKQYKKIASAILIFILMISNVMTVLAVPESTEKTGSVKQEKQIGFTFTDIIKNLNLIFGDGSVALETIGGDSTEEVIYTSSKPEVLSVSGNQLVVNGAGSSKITATKNAALDSPEEITSINLQVARKPIDSIAQIADEIYTGLEIKPVAEVSEKSNIIEKQHYDITYTDNIEVGTASVTVDGKGNYQGSITKTFEIKPKIKGVSLSNIIEQTYNEKSLKPSIVVNDGDKNLVEGTDYTILKYDNNIEVGKGSVSVKGKGNYGFNLTGKFVITPKSITEDMIATIKSMEYVGSDLTPVVELKDGQTVLLEDQDYTMEYLNNSGVSTTEPQVKVIGIGNYTGEVMKSFSVTPKSLSSEMISISSQVFTNTELIANIIVQDGDKTLTVGTDYTVKTGSDKATDIGKHKVTIEGNGNYKGTIDAIFEITKKIDKIPEIKIGYDGKISTIVPMNKRIEVTIPSIETFESVDITITSGGIELYLGKNIDIINNTKIELKNTEEGFKLGKGTHTLVVKYNNDKVEAMQEVSVNIIDVELAKVTTQVTKGEPVVGYPSVVQLTTTIKKPQIAKKSINHDKLTTPKEYVQFFNNGISIGKGEINNNNKVIFNWKMESKATTKTYAITSKYMVGNEIQGTDTIYFKPTVDADGKITEIQTLVDMYTITAIKGEGVVMDKGTCFAKKDAEITYNFSLESGYEDLELKVDGIDIKLEKDTKSYTFHVSTNHTISVTTSKIENNDDSDDDSDDEDSSSSKPKEPPKLERAGAKDQIITITMEDIRKIIAQPVKARDILPDDQRGIVDDLANVALVKDELVLTAEMLVELQKASRPLSFIFKEYAVTIHPSEIAIPKLLNLKMSIVIEKNKITITPMAQGDFGTNIIVAVKILEQMKKNDINIYYQDNNGIIVEYGKTQVDELGFARIPISHASSYIMTDTIVPNAITLEAYKAMELEKEATSTKPNKPNVVVTQEEETLEETEEIETEKEEEIQEEIVEETKEKFEIGAAIKEPEEKKSSTMAILLGIVAVIIIGGITVLIIIKKQDNNDN